ncbi:MAG: hypothetical protein Q7U98_05340 [Methylicorpusculum sp.]|uniref:hypothetical protein n=1 Tax=Methylicorpusculum sp. TaxID=2713644 RepID=UPI0027283CF6|nr:hypothetical protein [Methylicorpusculum sp.]MDO8938562.1 hypothetical protein [Methylicorpusculum sp.]MDP2202112.1 hypothetical protein [Methylicorpusculum sp.]
MNNQQKRNQRLILAIFGMSVIPFIIAWYLAEHPETVAGRTNYGELIIPPITTERTDLTGFDQFSSENLVELKGRWVMINLIPASDCNVDCKESIFKSKQLLLMMGKDLTRIRRAVMVFEGVTVDTQGAWWSEDSRLLKVKPNQALQKKIEALKQGKVPHGMFILMDPLGNLMMHYQPGFDPYKVKSDLRKLLSISQIG